MRKTQSNENYWMEFSVGFAFTYKGTHWHIQSVSHILGLFHSFSLDI